MLENSSAFLSTWGALVAIIWVRYFIIAGLFYALLWLRPSNKVHGDLLVEARPDPAIIRHEVTMSLISSIIYALPGAMVIEAWKAGGTAIYSHDPITLLDYGYIPLSIFIYLFIHDTYFYWTHRVMHLPHFFKATHLTHHRSRRPTPWAAFSFHPWEAIISAWPLPLLTFFLPIHVSAVFFLLILMTYCSVANHAGWEIIPRKWLLTRFGRTIITASHHQRHHKDYNANYGLYFRFWDQICKTDRGLESIKPIDGLTKAQP